MAIREGIPILLGPGTMPHNQGFAISEGAKGREEGWRNCSGRQTNFIFRIPHCPFTENLKHKVWGTCGVSLLPLVPSRLCIYCFGRWRICLWESDAPKTGKPHPKAVPWASLCPAVQLHKFWKHRISNCKRQSQCHCWVPSSTNEGGRASRQVVCSLIKIASFP